MNKKMMSVLNKLSKYIEISNLNNIKKQGNILNIVGIRLVSEAIRVNIEYKRMRMYYTITRDYIRVMMFIEVNSSKKLEFHKQKY